STSGASSTINISSPVGSDLTIQAPAGSFATIRAAGGSFLFQTCATCWDPTAGSININPAPGQPLTFLCLGCNATAPTTTLNLNGGPVVTTTIGAPTTVASGVTVASNSAIVMNISGNSTLFNSGTIVSSAPANGSFFRNVDKPDANNIQSL